MSLIIQDRALALDVQYTDVFLISSETNGWWNTKKVSNTGLKSGNEKNVDYQCGGYLGTFGSSEDKYVYTVLKLSLEIFPYFFLLSKWIFFLSSHAYEIERSQRAQDLHIYVTYVHFMHQNMLELCTCT
jgi:hypothetical protein